MKNFIFIFLTFFIFNNISFAKNVNINLNNKIVKTIISNNSIKPELKSNDEWTITVISDNKNEKKISVNPTDKNLSTEEICSFGITNKQPINDLDLNKVILDLNEKYKINSEFVISFVKDKNNFQYNETTNKYYKENKKISVKDFFASNNKICGYYYQNQKVKNIFVFDNNLNTFYHEYFHYFTINIAKINYKIKLNNYETFNYSKYDIDKNIIKDNIELLKKYNEKIKNYMDTSNIINEIITEMLANYHINNLTNEEKLFIENNILTLNN